MPPYSAREAAQLAELPELVQDPSCYGPKGCRLCMWGKAEIVVLRTTMCNTCARRLADDILRKQESAQ